MLRRASWLCVGAAILLIACGGDDDDSSDVSPSAGAQSNATPTPELIPSNGIYVVDVETLGVTRLPLGEGRYFGPSWSPDGSKIAYSFFADIYVANADGGNPVQVTENGCSNFLPAWSPDGQALVFVTACSTSSSADELARINIDGTGELRLTNDSAWDYRADWSADGLTIMGGSEQDIGWQIFTVSQDGTAQERLPTGAHGNAVSWARNGRVAITSNRDGDDDVWVLDADGSDQRNLTNNTDHDDNPAWSPDGRFIAFSSERSGKREIWVMDADGGNVRQMTDNARLIPNTPTWSADGSQLAFSAEVVEAAPPP